MVDGFHNAYLVLPHPIVLDFNPLIATLKPQSNGPSYSNTVIGYTGRWWVSCYIWYSEEGTEQGCSPPRPLIAVRNVQLYEMYSQCTNCVLFDVAQ